jgi:hypothetical protein
MRAFAEVRGSWACGPSAQADTTQGCWFRWTGGTGRPSPDFATEPDVLGLSLAPALSAVGDVAVGRLIRLGLETASGSTEALGPARSSLRLSASLCRDRVSAEEAGEVSVSR